MLNLFSYPEVAITENETKRLSDCESIIDRGLKTFVDVGNALLEIRDSRLYRERFETFEDYCLHKWGIVRRQADRLIQAAEVAENLRPIGLELPTTESQTRPLTSLDVDQQREAWTRAIETAPEGKVTAAHVQSIVDEIKHITRPENIHVSDDSYEWYTPAEYIEAARRVMSSIDLDPASCVEANKIVKATEFYSKYDNGLSKKWHGNVWLNPPYNMPLIDEFIKKVLSGEVNQAVVLTNNSTDTGWFHKLINSCKVVCFTKGRVKFWGVDGDTLATRQGQAIFYLGNNVTEFVKVFSSFGVVLVQPE